MHKKSKSMTTSYLYQSAIGPMMKRATIIFFLVSILFVQALLICAIPNSSGSGAEAGSIHIDWVDPSGGTFFATQLTAANFTVSWSMDPNVPPWAEDDPSASNHLEWLTINVDSYLWNPETFSWDYSSAAYGFGLTWQSKPPQQQAVLPGRILLSPIPLLNESSDVTIRFVAEMECGDNYGSNWYSESAVIEHSYTYVPPITPSFTITPQSPKEGDTIRFTSTGVKASPEIEITNYRWVVYDPLDSSWANTLGEGANATSVEWEPHAYWPPFAGTYNITLDVTCKWENVSYISDTSYWSTTIENELVVLSAAKPVNASFTIEPISPTINDILYFNDTSTSAFPKNEIRWAVNGEPLWSFEKVNSISYTYDGAYNPIGWNWSNPSVGTYNVSLWINTSAGYNDSEEKTFEIKKAVNTVGIKADTGGVIADGISSVEITVTLPATVSPTVTLTDGKTTLTEIAVNDEAIFSYVPDTEKLGLFPSDIPPEGADITLTAMAGGQSETMNLKVYRKPILLVHGLWSNSHMWDKMVGWLQNDGFIVYTMDYPNVASPAAVATNQFDDRIQAIKKEFSQQYNVNVSKIDVIAHSMGGVIARYYINQFQGSPNVDIHTLITVGTPHKGSPWPEIYHDWVNRRSEIGMTLLTLQHLFPTGTMGKAGPALVALKPESMFIEELNDQTKNPNNPHVSYYAICGTYNLLTNLCVIDIYDNMNDFERLLAGQEEGGLWRLVKSVKGGWWTISGDGIVELSSQRYAEAIKDGYYVNAWHCGEGSNHGVFEISSYVLKEKEESIPWTYRQPSLPTITVEHFYSTSEKFELLKQGFIQGITDKTLKEGEVVEAGDVLEILYNGYDWHMKKDNYAWVKLQITEQGQKVGTLFIRMAFTTERPGWGALKPFIRIDILSPNSFYVHHPYGNDLQVRYVYRGPITVVTDNGLLRSPDPDLLISIDGNNNTEISLLEGNITVFDNYNNTENVTIGQAVTLYPDSPMETPITFDVSTIDEWWATIKVRDHVLCKNVDSDGNPVKVKTIFTTDDMVYSWLSLANVSEGDEIYWLFQGPNNLSEDSLYLTEWEGEGFCYAWLNLSGYGKQTIGSWNVTSYVNGEMSYIAFFDVKKPSTGTPGFELVFMIGAITVILLFKRRKSTP